MNRKIAFTGDLNAYLKGYTNQRVVVFDDLRRESIYFNVLLQLLQPYPTYVKAFGVTRLWKPEVIYITAPYDPNTTFGKKWNVAKKIEEDNGDMMQLISRITEIRFYDGLNRRLHPEAIAPREAPVQAGPDPVEEMMRLMDEGA